MNGSSHHQSNHLLTDSTYSSSKNKLNEKSMNRPFDCALFDPCYGFMY